MQNVVILHFFENIIAHIKKKQYLCTVKLKNLIKVFNILTIRFSSQKTFIYKQQKLYYYDKNL